MKALVTGATGWIGSHVVRALLAAEYTVMALVRPESTSRRIVDLDGRVNLLSCSLAGLASDPESTSRIQAFQPDVCLHLAWYTEPGVYLESPANLDLVRSTLSFIETLVQLGCPRVVVSGTCFEYDTNLGLLSETTRLAPQSLYAASKLALYHTLTHYLRSKQVDLAWARIFYQYGPHEHPARLVPSVVRSLLSEQVAKVSTGEQVRDYLHVEDVASALCAIAASPINGPVNVGSGEPVTVRAVVAEIGRACGQPQLIHYGAQQQRPGDPPFICADVTKLRDLTGWRPVHTLQSGIADTVRWWREAR